LNRTIPLIYPPSFELQIQIQKSGTPEEEKEDNERRKSEKGNERKGKKRKKDYNPRVPAPL
jgi:hypothetical protein